MGGGGGGGGRGGRARRYLVTISVRYCSVWGSGWGKHFLDFLFLTMEELTLHVGEEGEGRNRVGVQVSTV